jgi:predicted N-acetyltransferase YhbS
MNGMLSDRPGSVGDSISIRLAQLGDIERCSHICFEAFGAVNGYHRFPTDFDSVRSARQVIATMFGHPSFYCIVAEAAGAVVGSNCMDERSSVWGIGPITIDPSVQDAGIGTRLMMATIARAMERRSPGVRLIQAAFHCRSMALYSKLGFAIREPLVVMQGSLVPEIAAGYTVRSARREDFGGCNDLCRRVHGHDRAGELADAIAQDTACVAEYDGRISAYSSSIGFLGHSAAENNRDLQALLSGVGAFGGPGIIVPARNTELVRWCLRRGLRIIQPMTLMTIGFYNEPAAAYLPSILY